MRIKRAEEKNKELQTEKEQNNKLKQEYEKYLKERQEIRDKFGITSQREFYERELKELFNALQKRLITFEEFEKKKKELRDKYAEKPIELEPISTQGTVLSGTTLSKQEDERLKAKGVITELQTPIYHIKKEKENLSVS